MPNWARIQNHPSAESTKTRAASATCVAGFFVPNMRLRHADQPTKRTMFFERGKAPKRNVATRQSARFVSRFCKTVLNLSLVFGITMLRHFIIAFTLY